MRNGELVSSRKTALETLEKANELRRNSLRHESMEQQRQGMTRQVDISVFRSKC